MTTTTTVRLPCNVEGCDRPKAPGPGKKYCGPCSARPCSIEGCGRPVLARGWCSAHYYRNRRYGTPHRMSLFDRLNRRIDRNGPVFGDSQCWLWIGSCTPKGYGQISVDGTLRYVHRVAYELFVGPIPPGLQIDHLCRETACSNPAHLEPVTHLENTRRAARVIAACPQGHSYDAVNTYIHPPTGHRYCRTCDAARHQKKATA